MARPAATDGLVIGDYGMHCDVQSDDGAVTRCTVRRRAGEAVCGDKVRFEQTSAGQGVIVECVSRSSLLQRPDTRGRLKSIAANVDQMVIVLPPRTDADTPLDVFALDRYLIAAECAHITPCIVINKIDQLHPAAAPALQALSMVYTGLNYSMLHTSCRDNLGIEALRAQLRDHTSVLVGPSGAGKSSLVSTLLPGVETRVGAVSATTGLGRHTTTWTQRYTLPSGGALIDSPGIREFGLGLNKPRAIAAGFREFRALAAQCRFQDCAHVHEPDCAVRAAVGSDALAAWRYAHYLRFIAPI